MVNLNWPEQKRSRPTTEASSSRGRMVSRETIERPKATISARVVLCSKCKCEAELEVVLDRQSQPRRGGFKGNTAYSSRTKVMHRNLRKPLLTEKGKDPEIPSQAEQVIQPQKMLKAGSIVKPSIHLASSSDNQFKPPQIQGESEPIPVEGQEEWIEENKEEQLHYEPSADDQNALLETGE
ncbi:unnamed protein product [Prunus armeniaca]